MSSSFAEEEDRPVFPDVDDDSDDDDSDDEDSAPTPAPPHNGEIQVQPQSSAVIASAAGAAEEPRSVSVPVVYDDSRRFPQRLWTDDDELVILQGYLDFLSQRGTIEAAHQHDTDPFYEQIKARLRLDFTKSQLFEKIRRLKKKFRVVVARIASSGKDFAFKSPHEQAIFEIARKIWSSALKRSREIDGDDILYLPTSASDGGDVKIEDAAAVSEVKVKVEEGTADRSRHRRRRRRHAADDPVSVPVNHTTPSAVPSVIGETVKSCLSPVLKELIGSAADGLGLSLMMPLSFPTEGAVAAPVDEKWRELRILELEVYLKRVELVQDQIRKTLEELKSTTGS